MRQAVVEGKRDRLALPGVQAAQAAPERRCIARCFEAGKRAGIVALQLVQSILGERLRWAFSQQAQRLRTMLVIQVIGAARAALYSAACRHTLT